MSMIPSQNINRMADQQQAQEQRRNQNVQRGIEMGHMMRNFNDNPVGSIVGSQGGQAIQSTAPAAEAAGTAAAGAGEAAGGAAAGIGELADVAAIAAL